jgi:hypothetical protein
LKAGINLFRASLLQNYTQKNKKGKEVTSEEGYDGPENDQY